MLNAIIIDDESAAISYLSSLIEEYIPQVKIVATASNALEGIKQLNAHKVDLIFLDIEMPSGTGFDLLEAIDSSNYKIVFTTAYADFALKAFKVKADGYLLKPIDIDDLEEIIDKLSTQDQQETPNDNRIAFRTQESIEYIAPENIIRIEGEGNYAAIYLTENKRLVVSKNIKQIEAILPPDLFLKSHKSHIINRAHVLRFVKTDDGHFEMTDGSIVPVSRRKKESILEQITKKGI